MNDEQIQKVINYALRDVYELPVIGGRTDHEARDLFSLFLKMKYKKRRV